MAGNIVKWWKHKILGGYKQFSVLQECTTDSEELMYPVRAPSSCSAPPDLLLVSDRENVQIKTPVNIISTSKVHHSQHHQKQHQSQQQHHHHQQQQQLQQQHPQQHHHHQQQKDVQQMMKQAGHNNNNNNNNNNHKNTETATAATNHRVEGSHQKNDDQRMHLEEFTCDVSVEGGKSSQPLQFSFTFYDLDGHHGKITKDDIVGIVYTIYESIGKSVVVPHCGSKTINVRLTVSPEGKSKSSAEKLKKNHSSAPGSQQQQQPPYQQQQQLQQQQQQQQQQQHSRRQHRYRPRKLIKSDDEEDDADSGSEKEISNNKKTPTASTAAATTASKFNKLNVEGGGGGGGSNQKFYCPDIRVSSSQDQSPHLASRLMDNSQHSGQSTSQQTTTTNSQATPNNIKYPTATENIYESMANLKCCPKESRKAELDGCKECAQSSFITSHQQYLKQASTRAKILRKARKQKYQEQCYESRQRSLSVGNESCWKFRSDRTGQDDVDGRAVPSSAECWNNALKRNDLIDIIRESMEKNRLCFQSNGKTQPNVSPIIRHRQRSNTVSKMHDENYQQQTSHHIPIYHQQMAINPAILSQNNGILHPKTNLCGYDSFLHATICSTINNTTAVSQQQHQQQQQQQQSLVPNQTTNLLNSPKIYVNNNNCNLGGKNNKILNRNIGYHSQQNSPQFHGYQRLSSSHSGGAGDAGAAKLNTSLLNSLNPQLSAEEKLHRTIDHVEKWLSERDQGMLKVNDLKALKYSTDEHKCKKDVKNYDNFLYAKLTEKLQEIPRKGNNQDNCLNNDNSNNNNNNNSNINNNKENIRRSHHSHNYQQKLHRRHTGLSPSSSAPAGSLHKAASGTGSTSGNNKFINLIPVDIVDPIECENLLHPTSDEDTVPQTPTPSVGGGGGDVPPRNQAAGNSNNGNNSTTSSSMIHRYVHEHIHHHYHHFENKDG